MKRIPVFILLVLVIVFASSRLQAQGGSSQTVEGILNIVWGDPHPERGARGAVIYTLEALNRAQLPAELAGQERIHLRLEGQEAQAVQYFGKRVRVSGALVPAAAAPVADGPATLSVTSITLAPSLASTPAPAAVTGTKKVIFLLLKFSDDTAVPQVPSFYTDMTNPDTPPVGQVFPATINGFFKKTSYNQFSWVADVGGVGGVGASGGWLTLPQPKSFYANCGWDSACFNFQALSDDGMALGRAQGINFSVYDNINFVVSNDLDCCAWGGGIFGSVEGKFFGATWEPPWGQNTPTYSHEMGHSLGLPHSGWVYYAYDSPWDTMSGIRTLNYVVCGTYFSRNDNATRNIGCSEPGDGFIGAHKDFLGWIPGANLVTVAAGGTQTVTLEALSLPLGSAVKLIKVCLAGASCTGSAARFYTVEARVKGLGATSQYDNAITFEGVIIHEFQEDRGPISGSCFFNSQSGWAVPVDSTPGDYDSGTCGAPSGLIPPNYALFNAQWSAGQTYSNESDGVAISVVSRSGSTFVINVSPAGGKRGGQVTSE